MNFATLYRAAMIKRAAAILTPEAEQAAVQPPQDPAAMQGGDPSMRGGMPMDPSMAGGGMPPQDTSMNGQPPATGPNGGMIPPEILQDPQFIQWLQAQGVQLDQASGQFLGPDGQPLPAEAIMQAYQEYQAQLQGQAPQGGDPSMQGGMPMDPSMAGGMPPQDPAAMQGGMPPQQGGALPPEVLQDQMFMQFLQDPQMGLGVQVDPSTGMCFDPGTGQPIPPEMIMQAYQAFQQQMQAAGQAPQGGDPSMQGGMPMDPSMQGGMGQGQPAPAEPEPMTEDKIQSIVDAAIQNYTAQLDKKLETLLDKLDTIKMAVESQRDTEDRRSEQDKADTRALQDEIAAELNPTAVKQASARTQARARAPQVRPINMFDALMGR